MKLKITKEHFEKNSSEKMEQQWRSLEYFLKKENEKFDFVDHLNEVLIDLKDEMHAMRLGIDAGLKKGIIISDDGSVKEIIFSKPQKRGRPKVTVFVDGTEKGMTMNQFKKTKTVDTLSLSEVVKRGIISKKALEEAVSSGGVSLIQVGNTKRISQNELFEYLKKRHGF